MFYENYLRLCNSIGKTPSAVALEIGIKKSTVTRWKQGKSQTDANVRKVADYFGVPVEELLSDKENAPTPANKDERVAATDEQIIHALWGDIDDERGKKRLVDVKRYAAFIEERDKEDD